MDRIEYLPQSFDAAFREVIESTPVELLRIEGIAPEHLDIPTMSERYFKEDPVDVSINANANVNDGKAWGNYIVEVTQGWLKIQGYYDIFRILREKYGEGEAKRLLRMVLNGDLYIHDSTAMQIPYCWSYSTSFILFDGTQWGQLYSAPAKRRRSYIDQVKEVTIELAQQIAGAVAIADLFVNYAYYVKKEKLDISDPAVRKEVENDFQSLVHTLNKKLRPTHQSPFSNVSIFDRPNLEALFGDLVYSDGSKPDFELILEIQKIFTDWFSKGDPISGLPYRFPVVTLNVRVDENGEVEDKETFEYYSHVNLPRGSFNIYISSGNKIASCCRLVNDFDLIGADSFGNGGVSIGSHRVVTINYARLGFIAESLGDFKSLLRDRLVAAEKILLAHRELLHRRIKAGFLKFFDLGIMHMSSLFGTFGINGLYEGLLELGIDIRTPEGRNAAKEILEFTKSYSLDAYKKNDVPFNVEQVPAETLAVKFAEKDDLLFGMGYEIYGNQFVPLHVDYDIIERVELDGEFSKALTGGGISHLNIGERLTRPEQMKRLMNFAIRCGCEHFAVNYNFVECENHHITIAGPSQKCPICSGKVIEQYTRVIGYFTPVSKWNRGRQKEHRKRKFSPASADPLEKLASSYLRPQEKENLHQQPLP